VVVGLSESSPKFTLSLSVECIYLNKSDRALGELSKKKTMDRESWPITEHRFVGGEVQRMDKPS